MLSANKAEALLCDTSKSKTDCSKELIHYPLFDTPYKVHANYVPILALRALAHGNIYKEKKSFNLERYFYVKNIGGAFDDYYAKLVGSGEVGGHGFIGRKITFKGQLNEFPIEYENTMSFSLPKKAKMKVKADIDGIRFLDIEVKSDGDAMTNDVEGTYFGQEVKYHTAHRDSDGILAGLPYKLHTEGKVKEPEAFYAITEGSIENYKIKGEVQMLEKAKYLSTEYYGPIMVKTYINVLD